MSIYETGTREEIINFEIECECLSYLDSPDTFKKQMPNGGNIDYSDQSPTWCSFYTMHGISQIDSWFSKQIQYGSKHSKEDLEKMIRRNPHLHNLIKTNLLINLGVLK